MPEPFVTGRSIQTRGNRMVANVRIGGRWYSCEAQYDPAEYGAACREINRMIDALAADIRENGHADERETLATD